MPLLQVYFPPNCEYFFTFIVDIVNFSIIPTDKIMNKVFAFKNVNSDAMSKSFKGLGYKSANILKNLGLIAIGLAGLAAIVILVLLFKLLVKKCPKIQPVYNFISAKIFFNSIIRAFLESYLKLSISTFIALKSLTFDNREGIINSSLSIVTTIFVFGFPVFAYLFL